MRGIVVPARSPPYAARAASRRPGARAAGSIRPESGDDGMLTAVAAGLFPERTLGQETVAEAAGVSREALLLPGAREGPPGGKAVNYGVRAAA
ncbi:hypothetical protein [Streptomyces enissocaesilis]|uniref:Uncharacterized protein n=1 Tax=Streptomyces enissocaesilis TaxID=332589 RepID=A0ABN3WYF1_9ACTN